MDAIETAVRNQIRLASARTKPGLEVALAAVREARVNVTEYCNHLLEVREQQESEWGAWAETETDCVPCSAETAPHTCVQPW